MKLWLWLLVASAALVCSAPVEATNWGGNYLTNDMFGHCGDYRLSPDDRIVNCEKSLRSGLLPSDGQEYRLDELDDLDELARAFVDKSDYADAVLVLSKAVTLARHNYIPYQEFSRGMAYLYWGKPDLATADFKAAITQSNDASSYAGLGEVAAADGRYGDAIDYYNKAIALRPSDTSLLHGRATVYARMGDYKKAMADDDAVVGKFDDRSGAYSGRCWDRAVSNRDLDAALADCNHALDLLPDYAYSLDSRGLVYFRQQKWGDAIADYTAALSHNPYFASSLFMRGISELRKGDAAKGQADIDQAEKIYPQIGALYAIYGITP